MEIGFVVVIHQSEMRPLGYHMADRYLETLRESMKRYNDIYTVVIIDNGSPQTYDFSKFKDMDIIYHHIKNQYENGITGAWNRGIYDLYVNGLDVIFVTNDDIEFNDSILKLINHIKNDPEADITVYGPVSNAGGGNQSSIIAKPHMTRYLDGKTGNTVLNGFFFGFTKKFYERFKHSEQELFNRYGKWNGGDGKWGGQEGEFLTWVENGAKLKVFGETWIYHKKIRGWKQPYGRDKNLKG